MTYVHNRWKSHTHPPAESMHPYVFCIWVHGLSVYNVYRPPRYGEEDPVLDALLALPVPRNTLVAGDFNATHWTWAPGARNTHNTGPGLRLSSYASTHGLIHHIVGTPTHEAGSVLDLAMSNTVGAAS